MILPTTITETIWLRMLTDSHTGVCLEESCYCCADRVKVTIVLTSEMYNYVTILEKTRHLAQNEFLV